jgi:branched-chain amino acid aminotransferase
MGGGGRYASSGIHLVLDTRDNSAMDESLSYLNGQFVPVSQMTLPATDAGFASGATVTEQLRTFSGRVFHLEQHLERLYRSLQIVGIQPQEAPADLTSAAEKLVTANWQLGDPKDDLGLCIFATPGPLPTFHLGQSGSPCVGLHTYPLPFSLWAEKYQRGQRLIVTDVEQVPSRCWPPELKCRSRIHYHLADRAAAAIESGSRALLLDSAGFVRETSTANILLYRADKGIVTPPTEDVLPGISLAVVRRLASRLGISWNHSRLRCEDLASADEVFLSSTPFCLLPVTGFNGLKIGAGSAGTMFQSLIHAWSQEVGVDIVNQAQIFSCR